MVSQTIGMEKTSDDREGIHRTALDYVEGWYEGNGERMRRSLHSSLVKRTLKRDSPTGKEYLNYLTQEEMVAATEKGDGTKTPEDKRIYTITILDVYEEMASVRADNPDWIDYLHLAKQQGQWVIVNVLYTANRANK